MDNVKRLIPIVLFSLFSLKTLILGVSWPEALVILALATVYTFIEFFNHDKKIEAFQKELKELDNKFVYLKNELTDTKNEINAVKVKNFTSSTMLGGRK